MEITEQFYAPSRKEWREWLKKNHAKKKEIWLVYYKQHTGKPRVPYSDAVEEALCFGWIDSTAKSIDADSFAQRFTPRKNVGLWSEPNRERVRMMVKAGKMTPAGLAVFPQHEDTIHAHEKAKEKFVVPAPVLAALKKDPEVWKNFQKFDTRYKRIRVKWITATTRKDAAKTRMNYFIKMTKKNKRYGMLEEKKNSENSEK